MKIYSFILVLIAVMLSGLAQIFLKKGVTDVSKLASITNSLQQSVLNYASSSSLCFGVFLYGISFIIWIFAISKVEISTAYPMLAIGFVFNVFVAHYYLGESLSLYKLAGVALIAAGCFLVTK